MTTTTATTAQQPSDAMMRRVQAMLTKASDPAATPEESATYMEKATELMAKYGIEQAMLDAQKPEGQREAVTNKRVMFDAPYALQKQNLYGWLAKALHCRAVWFTGRGSTPTLAVFGYPSDLAKVDMLYSSLLLQATRDMLNEHVPYYEHKAAWRRSFLEGFASTVSLRVTRMYAKVEQEAERSTTPGTALVLANRDKDVQSALEEQFPKLSKGRPSRLSGGGGSAGRASARRADIGGNRVGGQPHSSAALGR